MEVSVRTQSRRLLWLVAALSMSVAARSQQASGVCAAPTFSAPPHPTVEFPVGSFPQSAVVADFNGDGIPDLAVANTNSDTVSILLGAGDNNLVLAGNFAVGSSPQSIAIGDFNGDGALDLVVANRNSNNVSVLLGTGDGGFGAATSFEAGNAPQAVTVGDFNMDGALDLAVANSGSDDVSILLGSNAGSFGSPNNLAVGAAPHAIAVGDFNGDGKPDLAVANSGSANVSIVLGIGDGSFGTPTIFAVGNDPESLALGDFNGDHVLDLAVTWSSGISILLGTPSGSFGTAINTSAGVNPRSAAVADFNGDGKMDLAVVNYNSDTASILMGLGNGHFATATSFAVTASSGGARSVAVGDFNGDGNPDLAASSGSFFGTVSILLGRGDGRFGAALDFPVGTIPLFVAVGDLNADGKQDLAVANTLSNDVSILLGTSNGSFQSAISLRDSPAVQPRAVAIADLNMDGTPDLAVVNQSTSNVSIFLGTGGGNFGPPTFLAVGNGPQSVAVGDVNGDGVPDLAVANAGGISILLGAGNGSFGPHTDFPASFARSVALGDFNSDGRLDLAVANAGNVSILLGAGDGSFGAPSNFAAGSAPQSVATADFNGDGKLDLAVANQNSNNVSVLLGAGNGSFGVATNFGVGASPRSIAVGDFNADGIPDLATANLGSHTVSVLLGVGDGSFATSPSAGYGEFRVGWHPNSVAVGDFNGDGMTDLATANDSSNTVSILLNTCSPLPQGDACNADENCASGSCTDGVCCNTPCGVGFGSDCQACSVALGAVVDGICAPIPSGRVCRQARTPACDTSEFCDGSSLECPPDQVAAVGNQSVGCEGVYACDGAGDCRHSNGATCNGNATCASGLCTMGTCAGTLGQPCNSGATCASTFCADGVCCDSACGDSDISDCQACSEAAGAEANGSCELLSSTVICRPASGPCYVADTCTGSSVACPANQEQQPNGTTCSDGQFCNGTETCQQGVCQNGTYPCLLLCDEVHDQCITGCLSAPQTCRTAEKSRLIAKNNISDDAKNSLNWEWIEGAQTSQVEFGNPTTTADYALCIYAGPTSTLIGQSVIPNSANKWRAVKTKGYKYKDSAASADGITKVLLIGSDTNNSKTLAKGKGTGLPDLPFGSITAPVTVQLVNGDNGLCWGASYTAAQLLKNDARHLKAKAP